MSAQLCRFMFKLKSVQNPKFMIGSINKQIHLQGGGLFNENKVEAADNTTKLNSEKRGFDKNNPVLVASTTKRVIVGCNCTPDDPTLKWFYLEEGPAQVCDCGVYFKMDKVEQGTQIPEYSHVMQVNDSAEEIWRERTGLPFTDSSKSKRKVVHRN